MMKPILRDTFKKLMLKVDIKPLSVNKAFKGRRFKTREYDEYINSMLYLLPNNLKINPKAYLRLNIVFGFSSRGSDIDNALKCFIDCLVKKYDFDDRSIYELHVIKEIVKKKEEYIKFELKDLDIK